MKKSKFGMGFVLALVLSVPLAICWFGCGSTTTPTYTELPTLETAITNALNFTNGTSIDVAPPAGNDGTTYPAITSIIGTTSLSPGDSISLTLTTNYPSLYQITGAVLYVDNFDGTPAINYIKITQSVDSDGTMTITGLLADTISVSSDTMFNFKIALITDDNYTTSFGNYSTWTMTLAGKEENGDGTDSSRMCGDKGKLCNCGKVFNCGYIPNGPNFWTIDDEYSQQIFDYYIVERECGCKTSVCTKMDRSCQCNSILQCKYIAPSKGKDFWRINRIDSENITDYKEVKRRCMCD